MEGQCLLVGSRVVRGAVFRMFSYNGMLLACVGPEVRGMSMVERKEGMLMIKEEDRHQGCILGFRIALRGHFILVGDLLRSVTVLTCKLVGRTYRLKEVAKDHDLTSVMAMKLFDDKTYTSSPNMEIISTRTDGSRARLRKLGVAD